jgi:hypothetical protein
MTTFSPHGGGQVGPGGPVGPGSGLAEPADPVPPRGPGVLAPFPAPPRERNPRLWVGIAVLATVVVLCCGGGIASVIGLVYYNESQIPKAVDTFLVAVEKQQYEDAYKMQCSAVRQQQDEQQFADQFQNGRQLRSHRLGTVQSGDTGGGSQAFLVPADLTYSDGSTDQEDFVVISESGAYTVCGVNR